MTENTPDCLMRLGVRRPAVMGILNVTPDSFSDGGCYLSTLSAIEHARQMAGAGAAIIDVGGESTRPGAGAVSVQEELDRVIPVIEAISAGVDVPISIDTSKAEGMRAAVEAGAAMINDVCALQNPGALAVAADLQVPVCLMHKQGAPLTMQNKPVYHDVVEEVGGFLMQRVSACEAGGLPRELLMLDPGFGFGKTVDHNWMLIRHLQRFAEHGLPVLVGASRKSTIQRAVAGMTDDWLIGSVTVAAIAVMNGAAVVRVHDVSETVQALKICRLVGDAGEIGA